MNNIPWIHPAYFTNSGLERKYLTGIAINSRNKYETPSATAVLLNNFTNESFMYG